MDIVAAKTPQKLYDAIGHFLQMDYSQDDLKKTYDDVRKQSHNIFVVYSGFHTVPTYNNDPLDGLQGIRKWCEGAIETIDDITTIIDPKAIAEVIGHLNEIKNYAKSIQSLIDSQLKEKIINEINADLGKRYSELKEQKSKFTSKDASPLLVDLEIVHAIDMETICRKREGVQTYLSGDPTFEQKCSEVDEEIFKSFDKIDKLIGSNTSSGDLLDIYCKLNDIPIQSYFDDLSYSFKDYQDIIFDNCNRLCDVIDKTIVVFSEIQRKARLKEVGEGVAEGQCESVETKRWYQWVRDGLKNVYYITIRAWWDSMMDK